jgi:hypothetical protein
MSLNFDGKKDEKKDKSTELFVPTLSATKIVNAPETFNISGNGTVSSFNAVDLACEVQGKLNKGAYDLKPGIKFKKGDLLYKINNADALYTLRSRKSSFLNIVANLLPDIKNDFSSEYDKWSDFINDIKLNDPLPQMPAWKTNKEKIFISSRNVLTDYFSIKALEEQLNKYMVYAPFSGVITDVYATDFSVVNPGTKIMRVVETNNFEIAVPIPSDQLKDVNVNSEVAIFNSTGEQKGGGKVVRISEVINKSTQSVYVYVKPIAFDNKEFTEGEYVRVDILEKAEHVGVRLPLTAVVNHKIYLFNAKDSTLVPREISVLNTNQKGVFIADLPENSVVITQEVLNFTDTSKFKVLIK